MCVIVYNNGHRLLYNQFICKYLGKKGCTYMYGLSIYYFYVGIKAVMK